MTRRFETVAAALALAGIYFCAGKFGLSLAFLNPSASVVWPPAGLALAALLLWGYRLWPGVLIGAFLVNITTQGSIVTALGITGGNTLEVLAGAWLINRYANGAKAFERPQDIFKFVLLAAVVSAPISATSGVLSLHTTGFAEPSQWGRIWFTWWLGDATSFLLITPLVVIWFAELMQPTPWNRAPEWIGMMLSVGVTGYIVFLSADLFGSENPPLKYLAVLPLLWAAFRFDTFAAMTAAFVLSCIALSGTLSNRGPFVEPDSNESLLAVQTFIGTLTVTTLVLASAVSERKRIAEEVHQNEERFRQLTENISEVFWMSDVAKNRILYISPGYEKIWGRTCQSLYSSALNWVEALHAEDRERVLEAALTKQSQGQFNEVYRILRPDGSMRWIHDRAFPVHDASGKVYRIVGIAEDITDRKRAEREVATLAHAVESTSELICITDTEDRFVFVNRAFQQAYGYTEAEVLGKKPAILFSSRNPRELMRQILEQTRAGGWRGEVLDVRKDGSEFPIFLSTSLIEDRNGQVIGLMGIGRDITEQKRAESRVREMAAIIESTDDAIGSMTLDGKIVSWNKAAERIYGYTAEEMLGQSVSKLVPPDRQDEMTNIMERFKSGERLAGIETVRLKKDGSSFEVSLTVSPVMDHFGRIVGGSVIGRDITRRKALERELLEISADERRRFGHDLHDGLGQYLAGIALKAKVLEQNLAADRSAHAARAQEVVNLVNNAIRQTRSLAHGLDPIYVEANGAVAALENLTIQIRELFNVECRLTSSEETLSVNTPCGLALYRIAQEAIHNAVAHGGARQIELTLAVDQTQLKLTVSDDGKGFTEARSGMGLHIMRYRANSVGGRLAVSSQPGEGTRVEFSVPRNVCLNNKASSNS